MVQRVSDNRVIGPDYKDQVRPAIKNTRGNNIEIPGLLEAEAILAPKESPWTKASIKYVIIGTAILVIVAVVIGSACGATDRCSRSRISSTSFIVSPNAPTTATIRSPGVAPSVASGQPCGDGSIGNEVCLDTSLCCSIHGFCGSTAEHCFKGACGNGARGSGNCTNPALCCSLDGYCGSTPEYCSLDACGNGSKGNGNCADKDLCCSSSGYCGSTSEYCG